jgi:hypothetical protein
MFASANAGADGSEAHRVTGSNWASLRVKHVRLQNRFGNCGGGDGARADVDELTTSQGILGHEILHFRFGLRP